MFLDRDGVIIRNCHYLNDPAKVELLPGAAAAIRRLNGVGIPVIVVTNQSGIARGYFSEERLGEIHQALERALAHERAKLDAIYYCPHHPDIGPPAYRRTCRCRKPSPGMLLDAARDLNLDLSTSALAGDEGRDIVAGRRAGLACTALITPDDRRLSSPPEDEPDFFAPTLDAALPRLLDILTQSV